MQRILIPDDTQKIHQKLQVFIQNYRKNINTIKVDQIARKLKAFHKQSLESPDGSQRNLEKSYSQFLGSHESVHPVIYHFIKE
jgi:hypothetical protein